MSHDPGILPTARPLLFATAQEWIAFLPRPGTYSHPSYGEIDLTPAKLAAIVENFRNNTYGQQLPINAEHDFASSGALGWVTDMRLAADGSIEVKPEWNDRGRALIGGDRFKYVSAEFYDSWQDPVTGTHHENVANGLAVCTRPHFKTDVLRPLAASEAEAFAMTDHAPIRFTADPEPTNPPPADAPPTPPAPVADDPTPQEGNDMADEITEPTDAAPTPEATPDPTVALTEQTVREFGEMRRKLEASEKMLADTQAALAVERREKRLKAFTDEVRGRSDQNDVPWLAGPAGLEGKVEMLMDLAEKFGEGSAHVRQYIDENRAAAAQQKQSNLFKELGTSRGSDGTSAYDRVMVQASERAKVSGKTPEQEFDAVLNTNASLRAELARERRQERN